jgi:hypothetical protein
LESLFDPPHPNFRGNAINTTSDIGYIHQVRSGGKGWGCRALLLLLAQFWRRQQLWCHLRHHPRDEREEGDDLRKNEIHLILMLANSVVYHASHR